MNDPLHIGYRSTQGDRDRASAGGLTITALIVSILAICCPLGSLWKLAHVPLGTAILPANIMGDVVHATNEVWLGAAASLGLALPLSWNSLRRSRHGTRLRLLGWAALALSVVGMSGGFIALSWIFAARSITFGG